MCLKCVFLKNISLPDAKQLYNFNGVLGNKRRLFHDTLLIIEEKCL